jgi:hypothetical protein
VRAQDTPKAVLRYDALSHSEEARNARHEMVRADIARRLRKACSHLGDDEFAALVEQMVDVQLKSEREAGKKLA